jgi:hypothetical protein
MIARPLPPADPVLFGDLAQRLHDDPNGKVLADYRHSFETLLLAAKKKLHEPLSSEDFETSTAMAEGAQLGVEVISSVWDSLHS